MNLTCIPTKQILEQIGTTKFQNQGLIAGVTANKDLHRCTTCLGFGHNHRNCKKEKTVTAIIHTSQTIFKYQLPTIKTNTNASEVSLSPPGNPNPKSKSNIVFLTYQDVSHFELSF